MVNKNSFIAQLEKLLLHLKNSKPLEIDNILGHVVVLSKKYNYPTPFSTTLVSSLQKFKEG